MIKYQNKLQNENILNYKAKIILDREIVKK